MKTIRPLFALATLLLALSSAPASARDKLTLVLDWSINPDHAPLYVAKEKGFFREAGLDVTLIEPGDPNSPPRLVAAGRYDLAISYQPQLHMQIDRGLPLVRIGTLVSAPLNSLVVLKSGPIKSIRDLKGRKIGYSVGGFEEALLRAMLGKYGLKMADVTLINVNFSLSPALMAGKVDAVIGAFRNFELNQMDIEGRPGRAFFPENEGVPPYDELIFVANRNAASDPRLPKFLKAVARGVAALRSDPQGSWNFFIKGRKKLNDELNRRAWRDTLPYFADNPAALNVERYRRFSAFMKAQGLIKSIPPVGSYAIELK
ncbi:MAG TPA: ABC transporter substrate-binding protein [Alphaproteobacteria bacterium]|nr:ABC transporter substrate-binding protein [Alphaproteobacteria bacterium]